MSDLSSEHEMSGATDATTSDTTCGDKKAPAKSTREQNATVHLRCGEDEQKLSGTLIVEEGFDANEELLRESVPQTENNSKTADTTIVPDELSSIFLSKLLLGTYLVESKIASVCSSPAFLATDVRSLTKVAVKVLSPDENGKDQFSRTGAAQESALTRLQQSKGVKIHACDIEENFPYCIVDLDDLEGFGANQHLETAASGKRKMSLQASLLTLAAFFTLFFASVQIGGMALLAGDILDELHAILPASISTFARTSNLSPDGIRVSLTGDTDLRPTNDFIAFDTNYGGVKTASGSIELLALNRVIAQSVIVSLNAQDINTSSAFTHAQSVVAAAKSVSRSFKPILEDRINEGQTFLGAKTNGESQLLFAQGVPCYLGAGRSTNVYWPTVLSTAIPVSLPSNLKNEFPGERKSNGDAYMAGYTPLQIHLRDTTIDIAGMPLFPQRYNALFREADVKSGTNADPLHTDYLPFNAFMASIAKPTSDGNNLVTCAVFRAPEKDFPASIPRGYIRIAAGSIQNLAPPPPPVLTGNDDSFNNELWPSYGGSPNDHSFGVWQRQITSGTREVLSPIRPSSQAPFNQPQATPFDYIEQISKGNPACANLVFDQITKRMQQVDAHVTSADVKAALKQTPVPYGKALYLYSPGPGSPLRCDARLPGSYFDPNLPNDGNNSGVEMSCENHYNINIERNHGFAGLVRESDRAVFTPATGWRNLLGDLIFENAVKDSGTFCQP